MTESATLPLTSRLTLLMKIASWRLTPYLHERVLAKLICMFLHVLFGLLFLLGRKIGLAVLLPRLGKSNRGTPSSLLLYQATCDLYFKVEKLDEGVLIVFVLF